MNVADAIKELKAEREQLAQVEAMLLASQQKLSDRLELARKNIEILQETYLKSMARKMS